MSANQVWVPADSSSSSKGSSCSATRCMRRSWRRGSRRALDDVPTPSSSGSSTIWTSSIPRSANRKSANADSRSSNRSKPGSSKSDDWAKDPRSSNSLPVGDDPMPPPPPRLRPGALRLRPRTPIPDTDRPKAPTSRSSSLIAADNANVVGVSNSRVPDRAPRPRRRRSSMPSLSKSTRLRRSG